MIETDFHHRRAMRLENDLVRVTVTTEGGHIAEILDKSAGVNPLWIPPWPSIEVSSYSPEKHPEYGEGPERKLLSGIMGHNLCLGWFGPPSEQEQEAGLSTHGEAGLVAWDFASLPDGLIAHCTLPVAQLAFERQIRLEGNAVLFEEQVQNLSPLDQPIAWTQHVTLGPPFLEYGRTQFRFPATHAQPAWAGYTAHLMDRGQNPAWFFARSPDSGACIGYVWDREDFPWLGIWEENCGRTEAPWNGRTVARGMEFGASPFPEPRKEMIERHKLFDTPCYRWIGAKSTLRARYRAVIARTSAIPETPEQLYSYV
ncbi:MAG TPA: hypothetical protein VF283_12270 [Bryobacteraceae bacterium]